MGTVNSKAAKVEKESSSFPEVSQLLFRLYLRRVIQQRKEIGVRGGQFC